MEDFEDRGVAITLGVLALSGIVMLAGHMKSVSLDRSLLEKQLAVLADRVIASKTARKQVDEALEQREQQLKRTSATEAKYAGLLTDLLELSTVDPDARAVVQKWKIQASADAQPVSSEGAPKQATPSSENRAVKPLQSAPPAQKPKAGP
jgi:hypothetical protein